MSMWSTVGDLAHRWRLRGVSDLCYTQAFLQASRKHSRGHPFPRVRRIVFCPNPGCDWGMPLMPESFFEYFAHPCPITMEEEDE